MPNSLPPDAVVVRGGSNRDPAAVLGKVLDAVDDGDGAVLSVYCAAIGPWGRAAAIQEASECGDIPHGQVQVSANATLNDAGFDLTQHTVDGEPPCHYHVSFGNDLTTPRAAAFIACFDEPIPNPTGGKRRQ